MPEEKKKKKKKEEEEGDDDDEDDAPGGMAPTMVLFKVSKLGFSWPQDAALFNRRFCPAPRSPAARSAR